MVIMVSTFQGSAGLLRADSDVSGWCDLLNGQQEDLKPPEMWSSIGGVVIMTQFPECLN